MVMTFGGVDIVHIAKSYHTNTNPPKRSVSIHYADLAITRIPPFKNEDSE